MNGNIRKIFEQIELPPDLHERVEKGTATKRSVIMNKKLNKKAVIVLAAALCAVLLCAAGWPLLRDEIWGESAVVEKNENGDVISITQSVFDPAYYRPMKNKNMVYMPKTVLNDSEAEIMTVFTELEELEESSSPFVFSKEDGTVIDKIGDYRIEIGERLKMTGPWTEFTLTRESENKFVMRDSEDCGYTYYIYPMTGDNEIILDYTPTGMIISPSDDVNTVENGSGFTLPKGSTAVIGEGTTTYKKGDRVRFTIKFKNVSDEALGENVSLGYYLNPFDPAGETDGPAYRPGDGWFYPLGVPVDEYETVLEYPLPFTGDYHFNVANHSDADFEVESITVEVVEG